MRENEVAKDTLWDGDTAGGGDGYGEEGGFSFFSFCEESVSLLLTAYLFIIFCIYPFYMQNGYVEIGDIKYNFYRYITIGAFALLIPLAVLCSILRHRKEKAEKQFQREAAGGRPPGSPQSGWQWRKISLTDWAVLTYGMSVLLSYICSDFRSQALWGEDQWHMGLVSQLLFVSSYFLISRFWEYEEYLLLAFMAASSAVFLLGILNRFSIYPIEIEGANNGFLSTLGNINWYCGYWAVLFPIGYMLYWCAERLWLRLTGLTAAVIGIAAGVSQGSASAFLVFGGMYLMVFCLSFNTSARMKRFLELVMLYGLACQGLRVWRLLYPNAFNYYAGSLSDWMTSTRATGWMLVPVLGIYVWLCLAEKKGRIEMSRCRMLRQIAVLTAVIGGGSYILLLILNTRIEGGIRFMGSLPALTFSEQWGSARGATWQAGAEIYRSMSVPERLTGAGPDCFAGKLYTLPGLAEAVNKQFNGARLTNAHNEWLTVLVNNGLPGLVSYGSIFVTAVIRYIYTASRGPSGRKKYLYIFAMSAFAYSIHNVVSFQQILSTPFVFLMLGMGERLMKEGKQG
ncbi:MAG: O-antigen ligase family protein [Lachnospiraceae bacterium]|nr:O-antigen ligase family protein [Lachnospiraceae bacterium]